MTAIAGSCTRRIRSRCRASRDEAAGDLAPCRAVPVHTARAAARVAPATSADASCMPANTGLSSVPRPKASAGGPGSGRLGLPDRGDVMPQVHRLQLLVGGRHRALDRHSGGREHAEGAGQLDRQLDPHRRQRVAGPEVITRELVVPGNMQRTGHAPLKHGAERQAILRPLPALPASRKPDTFLASLTPADPHP